MPPQRRPKQTWAWAPASPRALRREEDRDQRGGRERRQQDALAREDAPGGPGVADVDEVEEPADDRDRPVASP